MVAFTTRKGRKYPAKTPDFSPTVKPNWSWPNHEYGFEYVLPYHRRQKTKQTYNINQTFIRYWVVICVSAPCR